MIINTDLEIGGTPTVVRELALRLREWIEVDVVSLKSIGPIGGLLQHAGVNVTALKARSTFDLMRVRRELIDLIQSFQYDTVFSFLVHSNTLAALARKKCPNVSKWIQSIQTTQARPRWHWQIQKFASRAADLVVVPSESVAQVACNRCAIPHQRVIVIPNAIDIDQFAVARHPVFSQQTHRIVFVGRLDPIKRIDDLIDAIMMLPDSFKLDIWGDGAERTRLEAIIARRQLDERVKLHGATTRLTSVYQQADLLVLPSDAEGFGLVLIEAMAAGVPVVATNVPGIRDVVIDQQNGLLVNPRDPRALAGMILNLANNPPMREHVIKNGFDHVHKNYSWERVIDNYRRIILSK